MSTAQNNPAGIPTVSVEYAEQRQLGDPPALLVDVREMDEYVTLRAVGSVIMPMSELDARFGELPQDRPLMLMCLSHCLRDLSWTSPSRTEPTPRGA